MRAHVFITDKNAFSVVRDNSFLRVGKKEIQIIWTNLIRSK
jgi:hypothetical protein